MSLATRLFAATSLLVSATVVGLVVATDRLLHERLEAEVAAGLERDARLVAALLSADSAAWPETARVLGRLIDRRLTLVDAEGRVRGDTEFDRPALARLDNHGGRPEIRAAIARGVGQDRRRSASTNEPQLYVAVQGGPSDLAAVRASASLATVDAQVRAVQRTVLGAGLLAITVGALLAWLHSRSLTGSLAGLGAAARAIAAGRAPVFPDSRLPEVAEHILALRAMHEELAARIEQLRREREETRTLIEAMSDGVIAADARGEIASSNPAARRLLGYRSNTPLPPLDQLFHDKRARDLVRDAVTGVPVHERELELDGRALLVTARALPNGGTLLVLRDVTELRLMEAVRRDFVANVSHELKTPLTSIAGYAETLAAEATLGSQPHDFAETILGNARRMQRLVEDLLDLARIESGSWRPEPRPVDLEAAAAEAWAPFAERARAAGVAYAVALAPEARLLAVDPEAIRQILTNLFDNALRHTAAGGRVTVSTARARSGVELAVRDTGSGIPPEHLGRIFERFYRVDPARSRDRGGTGLGLAIVKNLVEAHGGRVDAESAVGTGTTIRMTFPTEATPT